MRFIIILFFVSWFAGNSAKSAPITFNTALPVSNDEVIVRGQYIYGEASGDGMQFSQNTLVLATGYGINSKLALFTVLPFAQKRLQTTMGSRQSSGLGDARVFARYTLLQRDGPGRTFRIAPFAGVKLPTGSSENTDVIGILPKGVQSGSGTFDGFAGVVMTWANTNWQNDSQLSFQSNGVKAGFQSGSGFNADTSFQLRIDDQALGGGAPAYLYAVLEAGASFKARDRLNGIEITQSGGETIHLAPGLQLAARRWIAEISVLAPIVQNLNGAPIKPDFQTRIGLRINY